MMKIINALLILFLAVLQYQIWFGNSSARALDELEAQQQVQRDENALLKNRNDILEVEILDLKNGLEAVEERARAELGMIGKDEVFYLIIE